MRHIAEEMFADEFFGTLSMEFRVLWIGLIASVADDQGRFMDNAALIRSIVFPYDEKITMKVIEQGLTIFTKAHKIVRYVAGTNGSGKRLIQITNWWRYQISTQWARESIYAAPPKWYDRIRIHKPGYGPEPYTLHWETKGGYEGTYLRATKGLRSPNEGDRPIPIPKKKPIPIPIPKKIPPPPKPSSSKKSKTGRGASSSVVGGGGADDAGSLDLDQQLEQIFKEHKSAAETARIMRPILTAASLGKQKFKNLMFTVAIRIPPNKAKYLTLAALASVFADEKVLNKPIVAAHRIEQETVPPQFIHPATWSVLPENILRAADVNDLNDYITDHNRNASKNKVESAMQRFLGETNSDAVRKVAKRVAGN